MKVGWAFLPVETQSDKNVQPTFLNTSRHTHRLASEPTHRARTTRHATADECHEDAHHAADRDTVEHALPRVGSQRKQSDGTQQKHNRDGQLRQHRGLAKSPRDDDHDQSRKKSNGRNLTSPLHHNAQNRRSMNRIGDRHEFTSPIVRRDIKVHVDRKPSDAFLWATAPKEDSRRGHLQMDHPRERELHCSAPRIARKVS